MDSMFGLDKVQPSTITKLSAKKTIAWIKDVLTFDEYSKDEDLVTYLMEEGKLEEEDAKYWVSQRYHYINKFNFL